MTTTTKARPILFSAPMIRALLDNRKRMTRRIVKPQPIGMDGLHCTSSFAAYDLETSEGLPAGFGFASETNQWRCPYGRVGGVLWCRETWAMESNWSVADVYSEPDKPLGPVRWHDDEENGRWFECPRYRASEPDVCLVSADSDDGTDDRTRWRPSIFMPRWASRITLELTDVRVERVKEISEDDVRDEGVADIGTVPRKHASGATYYSGFADLWDKIHGAGSWEANPWTWVIAFRRIEQEA